jgi:hypothetical protein
MGYNTTRQIGGITKITVDEENLRQTGGRKEINALLEVKNLKVHFPVKHGTFSCVHAFAVLTPFHIGLNFPA